MLRCLLVGVLLHAPRVGAHPNRIQCNLNTLTGKPIMTTTASMMGGSAITDVDKQLAVPTKFTFKAGEAIVFTLRNQMTQGFVHATAGTLVLTGGTARTDCTGTNVAAYSSAMGSTFVWTAPAAPAKLADVTVTVVGRAANKGRLWRASYTLADGTSSSPFDLYYATLSQIDASGVTGEVAVFASTKGIKVRVRARGLQTSTAPCAGADGCGARVYSGATTSGGALTQTSGCADSTSQGVPYFTGGSSPWSATGGEYTPADVTPTFTRFGITVPDGNWKTFSVAGRPFVLHNQTGDRVACGMLSVQKIRTVWDANMNGLTSDWAGGLVPSGDPDAAANYVTFYQAPVTKTLFWVGSLASLPGTMASMTTADYPATPANDGIATLQLVSGSECTDAASQGAAFYNASGSNKNPWGAVRFLPTDASQNAFKFTGDLCIDKDAAGGCAANQTSMIERDRVVVVTNKQKARIGCAMLTRQLGSTYSPTKAPTASPPVTNTPHYVVPVQPTLGGTVTAGGSLDDASGNYLCWRSSVESKAPNATCSASSGVAVQISGAQTGTSAACSSVGVTTATWVDVQQRSVSVIECFGAQDVKHNAWHTQFNTTSAQQNANATAQSNAPTQAPSSKTAAPTQTPIAALSSAPTAAPTASPLVAPPATVSWAERVFFASLTAFNSPDNREGEVVVFACSGNAVAEGGCARGIVAVVSASYHSGVPFDYNNSSSLVLADTACTSALPKGAGAGNYFGIASETTVVQKIAGPSGSFELAVRVQSETLDIQGLHGKVFVLRDLTGAITACGLLQEQKTGHWGVDVEPLGDNNTQRRRLQMGTITGAASMFRKEGNSKVYGVFEMIGLEANLAASTTLVGNQRGIHLHFGDSCNNAAAGGAHYFSGGADPWVKVRYGATDAAGGGFSAFVVNGTSIGPIDGRRIIVHNDAAARKACGRLGVVTLPAGAGAANEAVGLSPGAVAGIVLGIIGAIFVAMVLVAVLVVIVGVVVAKKGAAGEMNGVKAAAAAARASLGHSDKLEPFGGGGAAVPPVQPVPPVQQQPQQQQAPPQQQQPTSKVRGTDVRGLARSESFAQRGMSRVTVNPFAAAIEMRDMHKIPDGTVLPSAEL